jgi:lysyl-tRNA synthetase class 1
MAELERPKNKKVPTALIVPPSVEDLIGKFDRGGAPIDELEVKAALAAARQALVNPSEAENLGAWAEVLAFALVGARHHSSPWNTYFGPIGSGTKENGEPFYSPDIAGTDVEVVAHWMERARIIKHPVLKARYADLAWDMSRAIGKTNPDPAMARIAIDAYLASLAANVRRDFHDEFEAAIRALDLAQMLRDTDRIDAARGALLQLHSKAVAKAQGLWWKAFDRLIDDKHARLTEQERDQLVADLEAVAARFSNASDPKVFDPHAAQSATERLIAHYNKLKKRDDTARLHEITARSFEHAASLADPMLASAFLQTAVSSYRDARLHDECKRVRVVMEEKIAASQAQMKTFTFETTITHDDREKFLAAVVVDDIGSTFARIASKFVESRKQLEEEVSKLMERAPLMAMIPHTVMAEKHVAAKVWSVEDDPFGRLIQQATQSMSLNDIWLMAALDRAIEVHGLTPHHFVGWAARSGLFGDLNLLMEGVTAWFAGDFVKTVHVLIPQVEVALRTIAAKLGKPTTKAHPKIPGVSVAVNMGDLLYSPEVTDALGADITLHLLTLYADPRGFNLRNDMAHGLITAGQMGNNVATRLIHTLLVLGIRDALADARKE